MKPLSEWVSADLWASLMAGRADQKGVALVMMELLRRERERCAGVATDLAKEHWERAAYYRTRDKAAMAEDEDELAEVYQEVAERIGRLP